jgi:P pilus assembly chaperone PapD
MLVNRSIIVFKPGQAPREDVSILNQNNEENLYVSVEIIQVKNPGSEEEERVKVTDPGQSKLIVTPNRLIVPPSGRKTMRLVNLQPGEEERIYRVTVKPVLPPLENPESSMVRIVVAYQLLVIVQPVEPLENLSVVRQDRELIFENTGNTNVLISEGAQCDNSGGNCVDLPTKRIYAGIRYTVPLSYDTPVSYKLTASEESKQEIFN